MAKIGFYSTSDFGYHVLTYLIKSHLVEFVVASKPKPKGRHFIIEDTETVKLAKKHSINVIYVENKDQIYEKICDFSVEFDIVIDFSFIISNAILAMPGRNFINIHPSLLPKYRGPSPLHYQIINQDKFVGVSIIKIVEKVDAGDLLLQIKQEIEPNEITFMEFYEYMRVAARETLDLFLCNCKYLAQISQNEEQVTYTKKIRKQDIIIDFLKEPVFSLIGKIKAFSVWPKVKAVVNGETLIFLNAVFYSYKIATPGYLYEENDRLFINAIDGICEITEIQRPGKKSQTIKEFLNGYKNKIDGVLTSSGV